MTHLCDLYMYMYNVHHMIHVDVHVHVRTLYTAKMMLKVSKITIEKRQNRHTCISLSNLPTKIHFMGHTITWYMYMYTYTMHIHVHVYMHENP